METNTTNSNTSLEGGAISSNEQDSLYNTTVIISPNLVRLFSMHDKIMYVFSIYTLSIAGRFRWPTGLQTTRCLGTSRDRIVGIRLWET